MRAGLLFLPLTAALMAASAPVPTQAPSSDALLASARADAKAAAERLARLEAAAARAGNEAERLKREQLAAAAAIEEAEARISSAEVEWRAAQAQLKLAEAALAEQRAPLAALLAGLVTSARQPPLLALADGTGPDEMVRVKALLDATQPVIERRSAALRADLARQRRLAAAANGARLSILSERKLLDQRRARFAKLEAEALDSARRLGAQSVFAGDRVLASGEMVAEAEGAAASKRRALTMAAELAQLGLAPPRPVRGDAALPAADFAYALPVDAPLSSGVGTVSDAGIVSRGVRFDNGRGVAVRAPAGGKILFAAPYRGEDGIIIIDHGGGRTSVLLGVSADVKRGDRVELGQSIGRALGPVELELRDKGETKSPAFIAASSPPLSNASKNR